MSFSSNVKQELCRQPLTKRSAAVAEAYGVLLYCNTFTPSAIRIVTESADFAARLPRLFKKAFGFAFDSEPAEQGGGKLVFEITDAAKIGKIFAAFGDHPQTSVTLHVNFGILEEAGVPARRVPCRRLRHRPREALPSRAYHVALQGQPGDLRAPAGRWLLSEGAFTRRKRRALFQAEQLYRRFSDGHRRAGRRDGRNGGEGRKGPPQRRQPPR